MVLASLTILGPLIASVLVLMVRRWPALIALVGSAVGLAAAVLTLVRLGDGERLSATLPGLPLWPFLLATDPVTAVLGTVVAVVGTCVLVYAVGYMAGEGDQVRFFAGMMFFISTMQLLVLAGDWVLLLTAWELIGLASYLLIGFWFTRPGIGAAATEAFLVTRAADVGLYLGVIVVIASTGSSAMSATGEVHGSAAIVAGISFLVAAAGKSAQAPLQGWLADAMVGPTPVSALLHAATLVVAGVIVLTRAYPLLPAKVVLAVGLLGGISSIVTGVSAVAQADLKRLLAASTSSQLGLMLLALGAGSIPAAIFHLVTHAAMKSSLFLAAGVFQHERESTAFRDLGGIGRERRLVFAAFTVAGLALAGVPPLAGFWSKDAIIAAALQAPQAPILAPLAAIGSGLTGIYVSRAIRLLWSSGDTAEKPQGRTRALVWMISGLLVLATLAATGGLIHTPYSNYIGAELPEQTSALVLGLLVVVGGLAIGWFVPAPRFLGNAFTWAQHGFRIGSGWQGLIVRPAMTVACWCDRLDHRIQGGVQAIGRAARHVSGASHWLDDQLSTSVRGVGHAGLMMARATRALDEDGLDELIAVMVARVRQLGGLARQLQTGLVHRELLISASGAAALLLLILLL